ncbi:MAG: hypothetical protein AAF960_03615 [Bacteroidota bacterium]
MTLYFSKETPDVAEIESKLKELTLAFDKQQKTSATEPTLIDGGQKIIGKEAILAHLQIVEGELFSWYYCAVDTEKTKQ